MRKGVYYFFKLRIGVNSMRKKCNLIFRIILMLAVGCFLFCGCGKSKESQHQEDDLLWTNENAVYAYVKAGYEKDILQDIEDAFASLSFEKVYVADKNVNEWTPLSLLFVLDDNGSTTQKEFIHLLEQDERINHASAARDLPFETVDTRRIEKEKDTISVGETLQLTLMGNIDYYVQPFAFDSFFVKPAKEGQYDVDSFPDVALKSVEEVNGGWLLLTLEEESYFNVIKACDKITRLSTIEMVQKNMSWGIDIPPIWQVSDETIVSIEPNYESYPTVKITGLKAGKVTVDYASVNCEIIVQ